MTRQTMLKWTAATAALVFGLAGAPTSCVCACQPPDDIILLTVAGGIFQPDLNATLLEVEALIDGQVVGRAQSLQPQVTLLPAGQDTVVEGAHTVVFRIVSQTASPTVYEIDELVNATRLPGGGGGGGQDINLGPRIKTLATGDTVRFNITVDVP